MNLESKRYIIIRRRLIIRWTTLYGSPSVPQLFYHVQSDVSTTVNAVYIRKHLCPDTIFISPFILYKGL